MFNNQNLRTFEMGMDEQILFDTKNHKSVGIVISDAVYDAAEFAATGRKLVRAGMPMDGDLAERTTAYTVATTEGVGVLWHTIDVTAGPANGTLIVEGHINRDRLHETVNDYYDANATLIDELAPDVKFYRDI